MQAHGVLRTLTACIEHDTTSPLYGEMHAPLLKNLASWGGKKHFQVNSL